MPHVDFGAPITRRLLRDAGLGPGMRVLDVGCGFGSVAGLAAELVGPSGEVFAIDHDPAILTLARERAAAAGLAAVRFELAPLLRPPAGPFDAITGRRVLMYQPDRDAALAALAAVVRPGGVVVFEEIDLTLPPPPSPLHPLHAQVYAWVWETIRREGATPTMGLELPGALRRAGLTLGAVRAEAIVQLPEQRAAIADMVRAISPRILSAGVATAAELDVDTLDARLLAELEASALPFVGDVAVGAWAHKPG